MARLFFLSFLILFICSCSTELGGGSTDTELGGPVATGVVVDQHGAPVVGATVVLVPTGYNPVIDDSLSAESKVYTDGEGKFEIVSDSAGEYSFELISSSRSSKALLQGISIIKDTVIDTIILEQIAAVTVLLPANVDTASGYLIVPGTTIIKPLSSNTVQVVGKNSFVLFDSLPSGVISEITYVKDGYTESLIDSVNLSADDTVNTVGTVETWENISNGLPNDTILSSYIDQDGTIWIGTAQNGLYKSVGASWKVYDTSMSLGLENLSNRVTALLTDNDNITWIGTDSGLASIEDSIWKTYSINAGSIPRSKVKDLCLDNNGDLIVLFSNVVYKHTDTVWYYDSVEVNGIVTDLNSISVDENGVLYVGANTGLYVKNSWDSNIWQNVVKSNAQAEEKVINSVAINNDGDIWCATNSSIHVYGGTNWLTVNSNLPSGKVSVVCKDNNNMIWAGFSAEDTLARLGLLSKLFNGSNVSALNGVGAVSDINISVQGEMYISTVKGELIRVSYGLEEN